MAELENHILMSTMVFMPNGDDPVCEGEMVGDITDTADGEIEIGFDLLSPKRRVYVRFRAEHLRELLDRVEAKDDHA